MTTPKAHCFVEAGEVRPPMKGEPCLHSGGAISTGRDGDREDKTILRRLPDDWLERAVERVQSSVSRWCHSGDTPPEKISAEIRAAILGPDPEPEPERWEREAAIAWHLNNPGPELDSIGLARHFAKHRRQHEERSR